MNSIAGFRSLAALLAFALVAAFSLTANAASQALGLVASNGPLPLVCAGGECQVHLSAFCMQKARTIPVEGAAYEVVVPGSVRLVLTAADGSSRELPASGTVSFTVYRSFSAIKASLPAAALAAEGAVSASLRIERMAFLVPRAEAGDRNPQTKADIALAERSLRPAAAAIFDAPGTRADAVKLVNALINALPAAGRAPALEDGALWSRVVTPQVAAAAEPAALRLAADIHESCRTSRSPWPGHSMRRCLESAHAGLMYELNRRFWDAVGESS